MLVFAFIVIVIELILIAKKKQRKEAVVLFLLGSITLVYGYYYNANRYTASLINIISGLLNNK